jgi:hypothetical protein
MNSKVIYALFGVIIFCTSTVIFAGDIQEDIDSVSRLKESQCAYRNKLQQTLLSQQIERLTRIAQTLQSTITVEEKVALNKILEQKKQLVNKDGYLLSPESSLAKDQLKNLIRQQDELINGVVKRAKVITDVQSEYGQPENTENYDLAIMDYNLPAGKLRIGIVSDDYFFVDLQLTGTKQSFYQLSENYNLTVELKVGQLKTQLTGVGYQTHYTAAEFREKENKECLDQIKREKDRTSNILNSN